MEKFPVNSALLILLGAFVSIFASIVTTYLSHRLTYGRDSKNYENAQNLQNKKLAFDELIFYKTDLNKSTEELYKILILLGHYVSLTSSVIDFSRKLSIEDFDNNYRQELEQLARMESLVSLKFPQYDGYAIKIASCHNNYWGHQRIFLSIDINIDKKGYTILQGKALEISNKIQESIQELKLKVQEFSSNINNR